MKRTPLRSGTKGLTRTGSLPRRTRLAPVNRKRGHKFPHLVCEPLREFVRSLACSVCGARAPSHPHHVKTKGSGGADRDNLVPLCPTCHEELHRTGRRTFAAKHRVDLPAIALRVTAAYDLFASPGSLQGATE